MRYTLSTNNKKEFEYAFNGLDYLLCLWDMDQWLRSQVKYGYDVSEEEKVGYENARKELWEILEGHGINLDDLE